MEALLNNCQRLSNVTLRCQDGLVSSHKVILAVVSPFIRRLVASIPVGDKVTVIMPDFVSSEVQSFLVALMEDPTVTGAEDICTAFGRNKQVNCQARVKYSPSPKSKIL